MNGAENPSVVNPASPRGRFRRLLWGLLLVAGLLRGLYLWDNLTHNPFSRLLVLDSAHYDLWAVEVSRGDWLGKEVFLQAPLYPYLLGVLYRLVGRRLWLVYLLQHGLGLVNIWLVWRLGRRWFDERVALVGAALFAFYPFPAFVEGKVLVTTLYLTWSLLVLDLAAGVAERGGWGRTALLGLVLGLASVTRANGLALVVLVAGWLLWAAGRQKRWWWGFRRAALAAAVAAAVVAPVTVRNWVVGGCFVPVSAGGGLAFARSNVLGARGGFEPVPELPDSVVRSPEQIAELPRAELGHTPTAREISAFWTRRTLRKLLRHPLGWLKLEGLKALRILDNYEFGTENALSEERPLTPTLWAFVVPAGVILALGVVGVAASLRGARRRRLLLPLLYLALLAAGMLVFAVVGRYRLPMMPVLALFAGQVLVWLWESARGRAWRRFCRLAGPAGLLLVVSFFQPDGIYQRQRVRVLLNLAVVQQLADEHQAAIDTTTRILTGYGDVGRAYLIRGRSLLALGRRREAEADLRRALPLMPHSAEPAECLALLLVESGRPAEALRFAERATRLAPEHGFAWSMLGGSYLQLGRLQEAEEAFRQALALDPELTSARLGLAQTLFSLGRYGEALEHYLRLRPEELSERFRAVVAERIRLCRERLGGGP